MAIGFWAFVKVSLYSWGIFTTCVWNCPQRRTWHYCPVAESLARLLFTKISYGYTGSFQLSWMRVYHQLLIGKLWIWEMSGTFSKYQLKCRQLPNLFLGSFDSSGLMCFTDNQAAVTNLVSYQYTVWTLDTKDRVWQRPNWLILMTFQKVSDSGFSQASTLNPQCHQLVSRLTFEILGMFWGVFWTTKKYKTADQLEMITDR